MYNILIKHRKDFNPTTPLSKRAFKSRFFDLILKELEDSYIDDVYKDEKKLAFKAPIGRFTWNGLNKFNPVSKGEIKLVYDGNFPKISYEINFSEFFFIALAMSLSAITAFALDFPLLGGGILAAIWLFVYWGSRIITTIRLNIFIKDTIHLVNNPKDKYFDFKEFFEEDLDFAQKIFVDRSDVISVG